MELKQKSQPYGLSYKNGCRQHSSLYQTPSEFAAGQKPGIPDYEWFTYGERVRQPLTLHNNGCGQNSWLQSAKLIDV